MPSKYCGKLPRCKNAWWCAIDYRPSDNVHCFEPLTNYDRIISKSPEELAEWLGRIQYDTAYYCAGEFEQMYPYPDGWLDWLKQEVSDGIL